MIFLCRHGQTAFNAVRRYQGQVDSPLTELGRAQARAMGRRLRQDLGPGARFWASPLGRAQETLALILAEVGPCAVVNDPRLMEVGMGAWDGLDDIEIEAEYPGARDGLGPGEWFFHGPGGEGFPAFRSRLAEALAAIAGDPAPQKVIVAHGVVSRVLRGLHAGLDRRTMLQGATPQDGYYVLEAGGAVRLVGC